MRDASRRRTGSQQESRRGDHGQSTRDGGTPTFLGSIPRGDRAETIRWKRITAEIPCRRFRRLPSGTDEEVKTIIFVAHQHRLRGKVFLNRPSPSLYPPVVFLQFGQAVMADFFRWRQDRDTPDNRKACRDSHTSASGRSGLTVEARKDLFWTATSAFIWLGSDGPVPPNGLFPPCAWFAGYLKKDRAQSTTVHCANVLPDMLKRRAPQRFPTE